MKIVFSAGSYDVDFVTLAHIHESIPTDSYLFADQTVADLHPSLVACSAHKFILPPGEQTKSIECFGSCLNWLASERATRKSLLIALGGGVIGDLIGFVASAYMRGVSYFQIPTTLLAQVDSSVGGKVAVDLEEGKNLAGAFYPPQRVLVCGELLASLPDRQFRNGMAEVLKYGFINRPSLLSPSQDIDKVVRECIEIKAHIVENDEFETTGLRATLNFGHTIAHAMEKVLGYRDLLHGEAVSVGMVLEARLGEVLGVTEKGTASRVEEILSAQGLPTCHPVLEKSPDLIAAMYKDKKAVDRTLTFSLLTKVGDCRTVHNVHEDAIRKVLAGG